MRIPRLHEDHSITHQDAGYSDGEIVEINQFSAYLSSANCTELGLGCSTKGPISGLSPNKSDDPDDWNQNQAGTTSTGSPHVIFKFRIISIM